jgi:hypothetical protein
LLVGVAVDEKAPPAGSRRGLVFRVSVGWSFCRYFRHGGARGGLVDDGFAGGERGEEGLEGEVVDGAGVAAAGLVDQRDGVVGEQGVGAAAESGPPRVFRTAKLTLFHAASCRFRYSSWTSCGVL